MTVAKKRRGTVSDAPMATTCAGEVLFNLTHLAPGGAVLDAARMLIAEGHTIFIGVTLPRKVRPELLRDVHDVLADAVGRSAPKLRRRGRARR
jgi:hypothetical protein